MSILKILITLSMLFIVITLFKGLPIIYASDTILYINPTKSNPQFNEFFNITIQVQNVINLSCWQLEIFFDPEIITCTKYVVPEDNIFGNKIISPPAQINNTSGRIFAFCAIDANYGVNGSGILCKIEFKAKIPAISYIDIKNEMNQLGTYLMDPSNNIIPFITVDGMVEVQDEGFQENTYNIIQNGVECSVIIYTNATVNAFEYNNSKQQIQFLATGLDGAKSLVSTIIPATVLEKPYAILLNGSATYHKILENTTHYFVRFEIQHSTIKVIILSTIPYDINGDRIINMLDLYMIAKLFGTTPSDPKWNPLMDVNSDEIINMADLWTVVIHFGETWK